MHFMSSRPSLFFLSRFWNLYNPLIMFCMFYGCIELNLLCCIVLRFCCEKALRLFACLITSRPFIGL